MVMLEAARALCSMMSKDVSSLTATQVMPAVQALQQLLNSTKPTLKFAALRTLNQLAQINPSLVASCNLDMEQLVSDSNRSIATFAITTLLKTGTESSVDRLMKQIATFMNEISDEFKVIVVDAIRILAVKFPAKQALMLNFLSSVLRDEGGYEYKKSVVEAIFDLVKSMPDCLESALAHLCEFIEDCEFTKLAVRILHLLGVEGPKTSNPSKYIRYIYNRVILENSNVRAAAVTALACFGAGVESVRPTVRVLLSRCMEDPDDEVRDRALLYLKLVDDVALRKPYLQNDTLPSLPVLYNKLLTYTQAADYSASVEVASIPLMSKSEMAKERQRASSPVRAMNSPVTATVQPAIHRDAGGSNVGIMQLTQNLEKVPELAQLTPQLFKSNMPLELTEKEMEYVVRCTKHIFMDCIVFEFSCINTVPDALLENVSVSMQPDVDLDSIMKLGLIISAPKMICGEENQIFVIFQKVPGSAPFVTFSTALKYMVKDCDPVTHEPDSSQGYDDQYAVCT
jgi:coatomer protein complex subunit gamma